MEGWGGFAGLGDHPLLQKGNQKEANFQAAAARNTGFYNAETTYSDVRGQYQPYMDFGKKQLSVVESLFGDPSSITGLPGYKFRLDQGQNAIENIAGSKGKMFSGATLQELTRYGQDYASNEYDKEINRRMIGVNTGMAATKGYDEASLNLADIQAGRGQAGAKQFEDWGKYLAGYEQAGRENFNSWFGGSGPFGQASGAGMKGGG